ELAFERSEDDPPEIVNNGHEVNPSRSPDEGTSKDASFESDSSSDNDVEILNVKYGVPPKCRKIECVVSDVSSSESGEEPETNFESEKSPQGERNGLLQRQQGYSFSIPREA
ncbi:hypothetical protein P5673_018971, partial [Acropora cervicornis]